MKKLDAIDLKILDALQRDGRLPNVALAKIVGLSPTPCAERVRALEASGVIGGYCARLDAERLDLRLLVFIEIAIDPTPPNAVRQFAGAILRIPPGPGGYMGGGGVGF